MTVTLPLDRGDVRCRLFRMLSVDADDADKYEDEDNHRSCAILLTNYEMDPNCGITLPFGDPQEGPEGGSPRAHHAYREAPVETYRAVLAETQNRTRSQMQLLQKPLAAKYAILNPTGVHSQVHLENTRTNLW